LENENTAFFCGAAGHLLHHDPDLRRLHSLGLFLTQASLRQVMYEICVIINRYIGFNMTSVYVGTGYNQVVQFQTNDKHKTRTLFGSLARAPVKSINLDPANDRLIYATAKNIVGAYSSGETQEIVALKGEESILRSEYIHPHAFVRYCLSNGSVHCVAAPNLL
jgi:hypothetical protein